ncbi:hypothetical protein PybrP1_008995 [[Pythium] brassicae (nom. inval.)]|nr:hypothetical protein PybrP1_008995 [[Pythium] brassicae (nom. inval.)]
MSKAAFTGRLVGVSTVALCAFACAPIANPTSAYSLRLAKGADAIELDSRDAFAVHVRNVAARVGVQHPERLSVRVGEETAGASLGANALIARRGACMVLPAELYDAFHATPAEREMFDLPCKDEINFVLAHESAHIAKNHAVVSGLALPTSMVAICFAAHKIPNKVLAAALGCAALVGGNTLLSWRIEHEADHVAAEHGYASGGINCFERRLFHNCELRALRHSNLITETGNYLGDTAHPLLTWRISHLKLLVDEAANVASDNNAFQTSSGCAYCLKV